MKKIIPAAIAIVIGLGGAYFYLGSQSDTPQQTVSQSPVAAANAQEGEGSDLSLVQEMTMGDPDAPVTMIEYASFTCPHCATFHQGPLKQIKENFIDTGQVRLIYREVYFNRDRLALWPGMVARCGGPMRYFGIVDLIYQQQDQWTRGEAPAIMANLRRIGKTAGLNDEQLDACLSDAAKAEAMVATWEQNAARDDVRATPSFIINGEKYSNMSYGDFEQVLNEKLGE